MIGHVRLRNIRHCIDTVVAEGIPGDVAEAGVWRGGAMIYAKAVLRVLGEDTTRKLHVFDVFSRIKGYATGADDFLSVSERRVRQSFEMFGVMDENVIFHRGLFQASCPKFHTAHPDTKIAVLRVDGNFYSSYQDVLYSLYDHVPIGGFVIFDDVNPGSDHGVMRAWKDFKAEQGLPEELIPVSKDTAFFRKTAHPKGGKVDFKYFRCGARMFFDGLSQTNAALCAATLAAFVYSCLRALPPH